MIVPPRSVHAAGIDVIGELLSADSARAVLRHDLSIEQFARLPV